MTNNNSSKKEDLPKDADGNSLRLLVENGSDISKEMEIDFAMTIPDEKAGMEFAEYAFDHGFKTTVSYDEKYDRWTCYCSKVMVPSYSSLIREQEWLAEAGIRFQAKPDGWGTFGNAI